MISKLRLDTRETKYYHYINKGFRRKNEKDKKDDRN